jgi:hypothetical protein
VSRVKDSILLEALVPKAAFKDIRRAINGVADDYLPIRT